MRIFFILLLLLLNKHCFSSSFEKVESTFNSLLNFYVNKENNEKFILSNSSEFSYSCSKGSTYLTFFYNQNVEYKGIDFETLILPQNNTDHLKKFKDYKAENFLFDINKYLFNKKIDLKNFKLKSKIYKQERFPGSYYTYEYYYKGKKIRPSITCSMKISDSNQLLKFNWRSLPQFKENKILINEKQILEILNKEFEKLVKHLSNNYEFYENSLKKDINLVYAISEYFEPQREFYMYKNSSLTKFTAKLCYELEINIEGRFLGNPKSSPNHFGYYEKINWILFFTYKYIKANYTIRIWVDPQNGKFMGSMISKDYPNLTDFKKEKYFWENWLK